MSVSGGGGVAGKGTVSYKVRCNRGCEEGRRRATKLKVERWGKRKDGGKEKEGGRVKRAKTKLKWQDEERGKKGKGEGGRQRLIVGRW